MDVASLGNFACSGRTARGVVLQYSDARSEPPCEHERLTRLEVAKRLALLKTYDFGGEYNPADPHPKPVYFVPNDTLDASTAQALGIVTEDDLFGGVVPYPFVATKTITHPLVDPAAFAPRGWSHDFAAAVKDVVLFGFSAFSCEDARRAAALVLERSQARMKPARGKGGRGQVVFSTIDELDAVLVQMDLSELSQNGIVIEQNFADIMTCSIGQVRVSDLAATYYGVQRLTKDNRGADVYGGSDLVIVRGGFDALLAFDLSPEIWLAVAHARTYDAAASREYSGLIASRRNYDVARVLDADGVWQWGVLEQSWRIGGASPAEVAGLEVFRADSAVRAVRSSSIELYSRNEPPPPNAVVYFDGIDERLGPITKYTLVEPYGNSR
jgi:hypothetical protein